MSRGGTVFSTGLREAQRVLDSSGGEEGTTPHIIFMSDGHNSRSDDPFSILSSIYSRWRSHGLKLNVLGFQGGDQSYLTRMAQTAGSDGKFDYASNGAELTEIFSRIAEVLGTVPPSLGVRGTTFSHFGLASTQKLE